MCYGPKPSSVKNPALDAYERHAGSIVDIAPRKHGATGTFAAETATLVAQQPTKTGYS